MSATASLDRSLVSSLAWTSVAKWASQLLGWASTLIVARLLTPDDYGLVGMAGVYLGLVTLLSEFGLGAAVLTLRTLTPEQVSQLHGFSLLLGLGGFLASCAMAVPLGHFFRSPQLPLVVVAMSTTFLITAFKVVPFALLQRELRFKTLAVVDAAQALILAVAMVAFAAAGLRYWTLVLGGVLGALGSTAAILRLRHPAPAWPRYRSLAPALTLSAHLIVSRLCWYAYSNADFLVAGRVLGKTALGFYDFAWTMANVPVDKVSALVAQVTPAFFSAVQLDPAAVRRYLLRITEGIALVTFPASVGLLLVAPDFVTTVLGPKWAGSIVPLQLLAAYAGLRSITPLLTQVLVTLRDSRFVMWNAVLSALVMPAMFYFAGRRWGTVGLGMVWVVVYPPIAALSYWRVFRKTGLSAAAYLGALWPALSGTGLMALAVLAARAATATGGGAGLRLAIEVATGVVTYVLVGLLLHRERLGRIYDVVRGAGEGAGSA